jgi:hypothetical protein
VTPYYGYQIDSVTGCGGSLSRTTYTTGPITAPCTVTASFRLATYVITATAGSGGTISPSSQTVDHGATASFTVIAPTMVTLSTRSPAAAAAFSGGTTYYHRPDHRPVYRHRQLLFYPIIY